MHCLWLAIARQIFWGLARGAASIEPAGRRTKRAPLGFRTHHITYGRRTAGRQCELQKGGRDTAPGTEQPPGPQANRSACGAPASDSYCRRSLELATCNKRLDTIPEQPAYRVVQSFPHSKLFRHITVEG